MRDHAKDAARLRKMADDVDKLADCSQETADEFRKTSASLRAEADRIESTNADTLHKAGLVGRDQSK